VVSSFCVLEVGDAAEDKSDSIRLLVLCHSWILGEGLLPQPTQQGPERSPWPKTSFGAFWAWETHPVRSNLVFDIFAKSIAWAAQRPPLWQQELPVRRIAAKKIPLRRKAKSKPWITLAIQWRNLTIHFLVSLFQFSQDHRWSRDVVDAAAEPVRSSNCSDSTDVITAHCWRHWARDWRHQLQKQRASAVSVTAGCRWIEGCHWT